MSLERKNNTFDTPEGFNLLNSIIRANEVKEIDAKRAEDLIKKLKTNLKLAKDSKFLHDFMGIKGMPEIKTNIDVLGNIIKNYEKRDISAESPRTIEVKTKTLESAKKKLKEKIDSAINLILINFEKVQTWRN